MTIHNEEPLQGVTATGTFSLPDHQNDVSRLMDQIETLTQQVAALTLRKPSNPQYRQGLIQCFNCQGLGHLQRNCSSPPYQGRQPRFSHGCFSVGSLIISKRSVHSREKERGVWNGSQAPQTSSVDPLMSIVTVATIKADAATIQGHFGDIPMEMMLDSGHTVSWVREDVNRSKIELQMPLPQVKLITASGDKLLINDCVKVLVEVKGERFTHDFLVVDNLITSVILGIDFLQKHQLTLNFSR